MKRMLVIVVVLVVGLVSVGIASANGPSEGRSGRGKHGGPGSGIHHVLSIISENTGLSPEALFEALRGEGATLAGLIEANGGDLEVVRAQLVAELTSRLEDRYSSDPDRVGAALENIEERIDALLTRTWEPREGREHQKGDGFGNRDGSGQGPRFGQGQGTAFSE